MACLLVRSAELIVGTEDFIRSGVSVEHVDSQLGDDSGVSTVYVSQSKHSGKNSITSGVQHKSVVNKKPRTKPQRKMYQCDMCTRSFTRQGHVDEHRRTHTGENRTSVRFAVRLSHSVEILRSISARILEIDRSNVTFVLSVSVNGHI